MCLGPRAMEGFVKSKFYTFYNTIQSIDDHKLMLLAKTLLFTYRSTFYKLAAY